MQQEQQVAPQIEGINIDLSMHETGVILTHLDRGIHAEVRPVIDRIFQEIQRAQQAAAEQAQRRRAPVVPIAPANDAPAPKELA